MRDDHDAVEVREFDTQTGTFVKGGFLLPEGKHRVSWVDADTLAVATEWTKGEVTTSGDPYVIKLLKRGQALADAHEVFRGKPDDGGYGVSPIALRDADGKLQALIAHRPLDTFNAEANGKAIVKEGFASETVIGAVGITAGSAGIDKASPSALKSVSEALGQAMEKAGTTTVEALAQAEPAQLREKLLGAGVDLAVPEVAALVAEAASVSAVDRLARAGTGRAMPGKVGG